MNFHLQKWRGVKFSFFWRKTQLINNENNRQRNFKLVHVWTIFNAWNSCAFASKIRSIRKNMKKKRLTQKKEEKSDSKAASTVSEGYGVVIVAFCSKWNHGSSSQCRPALQNLFKTMQWILVVHSISQIAKPNKNCPTIAPTSQLFLGVFVTISLILHDAIQNGSHI